MIARALSNPRLPPGGWATNDVRTDHLSMLRHPLRHRPPPRSHGLSPQARPLFWAEYSGGAPCFQLKQAAPKTIPQWKLGREPPVWWTAECDAKEAERRRRRARSVRGVKLSLSATELRNALKEALAANQDRVVDTLRRWDGDGSGRIDAREFFRACTDGLRLAGWPASTYMELFASIVRPKPHLAPTPNVDLAALLVLVCTPAG